MRNRLVHLVACVFHSTLQAFIRKSLVGVECLLGPPQTARKLQAHHCDTHRTDNSAMPEEKEGRRTAQRGGSASYALAIILGRSSATVPVGLICQFSTSTLSTLGVTKAGRLGPRLWGEEGRQGTKSQRRATLELGLPRENMHSSVSVAKAPYNGPHALSAKHTEGRGPQEGTQATTQASGEHAAEPKFATLKTRTGCS